MEWRREVWKNAARGGARSPFRPYSSGRQGFSVSRAESAPFLRRGSISVILHGRDRGFLAGNRLVHGWAGIFPRSALDPSPALRISSPRLVDPSLALHGSIFRGAGPWTIHKRFMGGKRKSMARARKNFAKKIKREIRAKQLSARPRIPALDVHLKRETRMRMVWNVKLILASRDGHVIPSAEFIPLARDLGFPKTKLFSDFVNSFPGIFKISTDKEDRRVRWLEFTDEAEKLIDQEEKIMQEYHEPLIVRNLQKILMMIPSHRVLLTKISHIRSSLWMPDNYRTSIIPKYPQYFTVTGAYLELASYDKTLAVTSREIRLRGFQLGGKFGFKISEEPHSVLRQSLRQRIVSFQRQPFPSPYEHIPDLDVRSPEGQKRVVAIFHEFLSLTVEKKAYVDNVGFFSRELGLPQKLENMLSRFPHIFYVSMKGDRHIVFLKEYYRNGRLVEKHPLFVVKQQFTKMMEFRVLRESRPKVVRGICAESFIAPRQASPENRWSFPLPVGYQEPAKVDGGVKAEVVEAATVIDNAGEQIENAAEKIENAAEKIENAAEKTDDGSLEIVAEKTDDGSVSRSSILKKLGLFSDNEGSDDEERSPTPATDSEIFLQLGFDDDEESPKDAAATAKHLGKQPSLGVKLGFVSGDDNSDDERQVPARDAISRSDRTWSWKEPTTREEEPVQRRKKQRPPRPFWEKKPFDGFNDPFF